MTRLHRFGALVIDHFGPVAMIVIDRSAGFEFKGTMYTGVALDLRDIDELRAYRKLVVADLEAAFDDAEKKLIQLERQPRVPVFRK